MKKIIYLLLAFSLIFCLSSTALAGESSVSPVNEEPLNAIISDGVASQVYSYAMSQEEIENELAIRFETQLKELLETKGANSRTIYDDRYEYSYTFATPVYTTRGGYAGKQLSGGYRFQTGGGFYFSNSGGPSTSASVSVSLPAPYNLCSFSFDVNFGNSSSSGFFVTVPNTTQFFKLYVEKTMVTQAYVIYQRDTYVAGSAWIPWSKGATTFESAVNAYAKAV